MSLIHGLSSGTSVRPICLAVRSQGGGLGDPGVVGEADPIRPAVGGAAGNTEGELGLADLNGNVGHALGLNAFDVPGMATTC